MKSLCLNLLLYCHFVIKPNLRPTPFIQTKARHYLGWLPQPCHQPLMGVGFTLAELLIALAILGIIATFIIPKILTSQNNQKRTAIFKESVTAAAAICYNEFSNYGSNAPGGNNIYAANNMNFISLCSNDCYGTSWGVNYGSGQGGKLASGADITFGNADSQTVVVDIDWNGVGNPPDSMMTDASTDDQLELFCNLSSTSMAYNAQVNHGALGPSTMGPGRAQNQTLYNSLFQ